MIHAAETDAVLAIRVTTRAAKNAVTGERDGQLTLSVRAAPADGEANAAVIQVLSKTLDVPKSCVEIVRGARHREKRVRITGIDADEVRARLAS